MEFAVNPEARRYINRAVRSGRFKSPSEAINLALRRLEDDDKNFQWLKREIQKGLECVDRGEVTDWDVEKEKARLLRRVARQRRRA